LEGRLTHATAPEGPFIDLTETVDFVRSGPVIKIDCVTHRRNPIYQALLPGKLGHKLLMGMPKEPTIFAAVNQVCRCTNVAITPGGASWLHDQRGHHPWRRELAARRGADREMWA
jgi:UbiD family decarboxylase